MPRKSSPPAKGAKPAAKAKAAAKATAKAPAQARSARQKESSLADLKRQVLTLAKVSTTKELKRANVDLRHLDFRLKASWRSALGVLQQAEVAMAEWERNPPEEYKELFAEIDQAAAAYSASIDQGIKLSSQLRDAADDLDALAEIDQAAAAYSASIEQGIKLSSQLRDAADDLDALAGELQEEAEELKTIEQASRKQRRARSLN